MRDTLYRSRGVGVVVPELVPELGLVVVDPGVVVEPGVVEDGAVVGAGVVVVLDVDPSFVFVEDVLVVVFVAEPFAGVHGTCVEFDGVRALDEPGVEFCAAAYPPIESATANANALIVAICRFIGCSLGGWNQVIRGEKSWTI